jgi:toxin FitB
VTYLLDTCLLSELLRKEPRSSVVAWLKGQSEQELYVSVLTLGELRKGIAKLASDVRRRELESWVDRDLKGRFGARLLGVDEGIATAWGSLCGEAERRGQPLPVIDSLLAATAQVRQLVVATRNVDDFERCGATVVNPWEPSELSP